MGSGKAKHRWVDEKVETQISRVHCLVGFAKAFTQTSNTVLMMPLHQAWQFFH